MNKVLKVSIAIVVLLIIFLPPISKLHQLQSKNEELLKKNQFYEIKNEALNKEIERLKNDPAYLEQVAREKLKVAREGEVVYKVETEESQ